MKRIKKLTREQIIISIDRLTRFKNTETKYLRVFKDIIIQNLIEPKFKKSELDKMDYEKLKNLAQDVFNYTLGVTNNLNINKKLLDYEKSVFEISKETANLLDNNINYSECLKYIDKTSPKNLRWLKELGINSNIKLKRDEFSLQFPIEVVVIAEGITEETLLPEFGKICGFDFDKEGIYVISAGGKNQVVKLYYKLVETLKLPIFVLLDKDGFENSLEISAKLRLKDKIHLLECGEFEDLLPETLIKKTLEYELKNISIPVENSNIINTSRVEFLEEVFKKRGMHEFKKSEFAQMVRHNIHSKDDISPEISEIIAQIKNLKSCC
ncbi:ATP-dependent endonuclease [bacterium]|nr:ATP-dependent endonuclease [bacterium]MBP3820684.1 ATP-dependent endonuclease [bacterium]